MQLKKSFLSIQKQNEIISIYGSWESKSEERNKLKKESEDLNNQFDSTLVQLQKITEENGNVQ